MSHPLVYLILGPVGSGRRPILADLLGNGLSNENRPVLLEPDSEGEVAADNRPSFSEWPNLVRGTWSWRSADERAFRAEIPDGATHVFFLSDGRTDPVEQIEALRSWLPVFGAELARVITVVHCRLGFEHPELARWYEACVHFSDVVLLNRREGVPNEWTNEFTARIRKQHLPCLVEFVRNDEVKNPALVLEPQARRLSLFFDEEDQWPVLDEDDTAVGDDEDDAFGEKDPYVERYPSGKRVREIPDIAQFL